MRANESYEFFMERMGDKKHKIHCKAVVDACLGMIKGTDLNKDVFIIAGWIHDMGKLTDERKHEVESLKFLDEFLGLYPKYEHLRDYLEDCILNHRSNGKPKTIYGKIFQCADKVALHNKKWLNFI